MEIEKKHPRISLFSDWIPKVRSKAIIKTILGGEYKYTLYDTIRISEIDGIVTAGFFESKQPIL